MEAGRGVSGRPAGLPLRYPEGAAPPLVGVVVRRWLGGPAAHAPCTKACFTSVTTGELGFLFSPFVSPGLPCCGRGWSARGRGPGPVAGLAESGAVKLVGPRSRPGILGLLRRLAGPSRGQPGLGLPLPWSRGGGGGQTGPPGRASLPRGSAEAALEAGSLAQRRLRLRGCSVSPRQGLEEVFQVP